MSTNGVNGKTEPVARITIDFHESGSHPIDVKIEGLKGLTMGKLRRAYPHVYKAYSLARRAERKELGVHASRPAESRS